MDDGSDAGAEGDLVHLYRVADQLEALLLVQCRQGLRVTGWDIQFPFAAAAFAIPGDEGSDDLPGAGAAIEVEIDVPLRHPTRCRALLAVRPDQELTGFGDFLFGIPCWGVQVVARVRGEPGEAGERGRESNPSRVSSSSRLPIMVSSCFTFAPRIQVWMLSGRRDSRRAAISFLMRVRGVVGFENGIKIALDDASDAPIATEPFSFGPALIAGHHRPDDAGTIAANILPVSAAAGE